MNQRTTGYGRAEEFSALRVQPQHEALLFLRPSHNVERFHRGRRPKNCFSYILEIHFTAHRHLFSEYASLNVDKLLGSWTRDARYFSQTTFESEFFEQRGISWLEKAGLCETRSETTSSVFSLFCKFFFFFLLGFTWFYLVYDSLHQQLQRGKAIQQRPYSTVEAAAANQLTLPSFKKNTKSNLRKQGTKNS